MEDIYCEEICGSKISKLIGLSFTDFKSLVRDGKEIHLQAARLIPFYKPGDEMALTSIFMSAMRLVKEFRKNVSKAISLTPSGTIHIFTEIEFLLFDKKRIDGLIIIVKGNKIVDAVLIEVKNKNNELDAKQIKNYASIAKKYGVNKLLTISNQFVSFPTQSPINVKTPKSVSLYHLSWSYILTIAHILLIENDNNIDDTDQVEIMKEVVNYFESQNSGVVGFSQMKQGWTEVVQKTNAGASLKINDQSVDETVSSWLEEERDMSLILSRELGLLVKSGHNKYKNDLQGRINSEKRSLAARVRLDNSNLELLPGALLEITIKYNERNSLSIPDTSVILEGNKVYVYKVNKDNLAKKAEVKIGIRNEGYLEVTSGLNEGETIVAEGLKKVRPNGKIKPINR